VVGVPGLVMLQRFAPLGVREPQFTVEAVKPRASLGTAALAMRAVAGACASGAFAVMVITTLAALKAMQAAKGAVFDFTAALGPVVHPETLTDWVQVAGILAFALIGGLFVAAVSAARRGAVGAMTDANHGIGAE
jgi:PAT family beta-lactamase induction signal transducer AmpG